MIAPRRALGVAGIAVVVLGGMLFPAPVGATERAAVALLEQAREAAQKDAYTGTLRIEWQDGRRLRAADVAVHSANGVLRFGDDVVGTGAHRLVRSPKKGWETVWRHDVVALGPSPTLKYALSVSEGPEIAGHATNLIEVRLKPGVNPAERLYLHRETGLMLRQELLDARGEPYRSIGFVEVTPAATPPVAPESSIAREPASIGSMPSRYDAPERLGRGYRLVGSYARSPKLVHLFYSDGLHGLSVFEQRGRLAKRTMPAGGELVELAGQTVRSYSIPVGEAVVWESDGVVYTVVSDAHRDDVAAAVAELPHDGPPGRLRQVAEAVVALFRWR